MRLLCISEQIMYILAHSNLPVATYFLVNLSPLFIVQFTKTLGGNTYLRLPLQKMKLLINIHRKSLGIMGPNEAELWDDA